MASRPGSDERNVDMMATELMYKCGKCGIENVRLYRPTNCFVPAQYHCNKCAYISGNYSPLILDPDGLMWNYRDVDPEIMDAWQAMPEADTASVLQWVDGRLELKLKPLTLRPKVVSR